MLLLVLFSVLPRSYSSNNPKIPCLSQHGMSATPQRTKELTGYVVDKDKSITPFHVS